MKPKICKILGIELGQPFTYDGAQYRVCETEYGLRLETNDVDKLWHLVDSTEVLEMIEHPERVTDRPRWLDKDIADAQNVKCLLPDADTVMKCKSGMEIQVFDSHGNKRCSIYAASQSKMFPSLAAGTIASLAEILGGGRHERT